MTSEEQYINRYKDKWEELEQLIKIIAKKGYVSLQPDELKTYLYLMKSISHHLIYCRTHFPDSDVCKYLNELSVRANNYLYTVKKSGFNTILQYFKVDFSEKLREHKSYMYVSTAIFMLGAIVSYIMVVMNQEYAAFFLPMQYIEGMDWSMQESGWTQESFPLLSSFVMVNNIGVTIKAFAFGITAGLLTVYVLWLNGDLLGALTSLAVQNAPNVKYYFALILPHGIIELTAIFIAGSAGLIIGKALLMPNGYSRKHAVIHAAKEGAFFIPGVAAMLIVAGLIEGFLTPARISADLKLIFALGTFFLLVVYFIKSGKKITK